LLIVSGGGGGMRLANFSVFQPEDLVKPEFVAHVHKTIENSPEFVAFVDELIHVKPTTHEVLIKIIAARKA
jgi:hypothetical protein